MKFLSLIRNWKKTPITPKTAIIHKDSESKNSMMGSVYGKQPQTCGEWQQEHMHRADFTNTETS